MAEPERHERTVVAAWARAVGTASPLLRPLAGGSEGAPILVVGPGGRFVLRGYGRGADAEGRATVALAASGAASRQGVAAPRPVPTDGGSAFWTDADDGSVWALVRWLPGRPRRSWLGLGAADARALGAALAALHAALRALPPDVAGPGPAGEVARHGRPADQVLHGDPSQGNVLWRTGGGVASVGFVDFDRAHRGAVERDLGRVLVGMAPWAGPGQAQAFPAFLAGYAAAGGRPGRARLRRAVALALDEGETWLERAHLTAVRRRAGRRWLERARAVDVGSDLLAPGNPADGSPRG
jgi:Ser/Thr protein kinase RdoA (MazF antagonist)